MRCPVCEDEKLAISSRDGVEIDYCPQCRGVWLDRGELDKIIDRVGSGAPAAVPSREERPRDEGYRSDDRYRGDDRDRYDPRRDDRSYDKKRKRRSFLDDMFDFD